MEIIGTIILDGDVTFLFGMIQGDAGGEAMLEFVLKMPECWGEFDRGTPLFAASFFAAGCSGKMPRDQLLGITYGGATPDELFGKEALFFKVLYGEENFGVTDSQAPLGQVTLDFGVKLHEAHRIGNGGTALADAPGDIILGEAEFLGEAAVGGGFFDRIESLALEVLDKSQFQNFLIGGLTDNDRSFVKTDFLRGPKTAFPGDEFVFSSGKADDQRLNDSPLADGFDQFVKLFDGKFGTGLKRARDNLVEWDILDAFALFFRRDGGSDTRVDQGSQTFAKTLSETFSQGSFILMCSLDPLPMSRGFIS